MKPIRAFVAINIPDKTRKALADFTKREFGKEKSVRPVRPENIHLTMKFLGEVDMNSTGEISRRLAGATEGVDSFAIKIAGIGAFPSPGRARIIWAGVRDETGNLEKLQRNIETGLAKIGFKKEKKRFTPHMTIGRIRKFDRSSHVAEIIERHSEKFFRDGHVSSFDLVMSELDSSGPTYTVLGTFDLG